MTPLGSAPPGRVGIGPIVLALGSNIGPRRQTLELACRLLARRGVCVVRRSRLYWTRPWGVTDQPAFVNAAVVVATAHAPWNLLSICLSIELEMGRRRLRHWGPRRIDLDLIMYGHCRVNRPGLVLPHPQLARRDFVLAPLVDLGVPPLASASLRGFRADLAAIPAAERAIIHSEAWS